MPNSQNMAATEVTSDFPIVVDSIDPDEIRAALQALHRLYESVNCNTLRAIVREAYDRVSSMEIMD